MKVRALVGHEGGVPPVVLWISSAAGWGLYVATRRWRYWLGPAYGGVERERVR